MSITNLKKQAEQALRTMEIGKEFPSKYVVSRFDAAWDKNQKDQVIGNMRSVICKMASRQSFFTQNEITAVYDKFSNISGGGSAFREELGDLIRDGYGKVAEREVAGMSKTAADMSKAVTTNEKSALADAFGVLFSFGGNSDNGVVSTNLVKKAERLVSLELNAMGLRADHIKTVTSNEHFILCNAYYRNADQSVGHVSIPVQISNGSVSIPDQVVSDGTLIKLNKQNVLVTLKTANKVKKDSNIAKYADSRQTEMISTPMAKAPAALQPMIDLSDEALLASSKYTQDQIRMASSVVSTEVSGWGARAQVKFAGTNNRGLSFAVKTATSAGEKSFVVPVEIQNNRVAMPSEFAADGQRYDFSPDGYRTFLAGAKSATASATFSRETDELERLDYSGLMNVVLDGIITNDDRASSDALNVIASEYPDKYLGAFDDYRKLLKTASQTFDQDIVKTAIKAGHLIRSKNSVEWFCPKLGLPLSKIAFDEMGRPVPKFRSEKRDLETMGDVSFSTSKILIS
jgi:hypothetical protein